MATQHHNASYEDTFLTSHPRQGLHAVLEKQRQGHALDDELAQYFKERAAIEDHYSKSLVRASKRLFVLDKDALGGFLPVWELLLNELTEMSTAHGVLSYKIIEHIEHPLKTPPSKDLAKIKSMEPSLHQLARDYETSVKGKSGKASLFKSAKSQPDKLLATWHRDGKTFLQLCEKVERERMARWKFLVEEFEHINKEQLEKRDKIASVTLTAATSYNIDSEVEKFCADQHSSMLAPLASAHDAPAPVVSRSSPTSTSSSIHSPTSTQPAHMSQPAVAPAAKSKLRSRFSLLRKSKRPLSTVQREPSIQPIPEQDDSHEPPYVASPELITSQDRTAVASAIEPPVSNSGGHPAQTYHTPAVDAEGYSIPLPDRGLGDVQAVDLENHSGFDSITPSSSSQRFKVDIRDQTVNDVKQTDKEKATLTRVSSMLRETTPTISQRRRGRRQNMRVQSELFEHGPPSPLSFVNTDMATTPNQEPANNPFRQSPIISNDPFQTSSSPKTASLVTPTSQHQQDQLPWSASVREVVTAKGAHAHVNGQILLTSQVAGDSASTSLHGHIYHPQHPELTWEPLAAGIVTAPSHDESTSFTMTSLAPSGSPVPVLSYRYALPLDQAVPALLQPSWKISDTRAMLMIKYQVIHPLLWQHGRLLITIKLENAMIQHAQSTPEGIWDKQKNIFTWRSKELIPFGQQQAAALGAGHPHRLLAKFDITPASPALAVQPSVHFKFASLEHILTPLSLAATTSLDHELPLLVHDQYVKSDLISLS
ncbi:hypothetical protein DM01DRAFT_1335761 [Hesseltinella vesiculosa]|uniref:MHD domain-containing protein n=1 Tax=Hesseltinella vesiculosa TaxID=101127 RepID=A0A1X2GIX7_9FUNG|nr:hypothetical protein DM01DRAFT_1335761 [Hesseltinella vesiculosa]